MPPKTANSGGRSKVALDIKNVTTPSGYNQYGRVKRRRQQLRADGCETDEINRIVDKDYIDQHSTCKGEIWHHIKKHIKMHPKVEEVGQFYLGADGWKEFKIQFQSMRNNRRKHKDHKFLRPWYTEAWRKHKGLKLGAKKPNHMPHMSETKLDITFDACPCPDTNCKQRFKMSVNIGYALLIAVDGMTRVQFTKGVMQHDDREDRDNMDISHLHGIGNDCNPLNLLFEEQQINLSRKNCHRLEALSQHPDDDFCDVPEHAACPCFLYGTKMQYQWPQMIERQYDAAQRGQPPIDGFDGIRFQW